MPQWAKYAGFFIAGYIVCKSPGVISQVAHSIQQVLQGIGKG